jgi:hypothetical protein
MSDYVLMPKAKFTIEDMLSEVRTRGMAKPNRFEVIITPPKCLLNYKTDDTLAKNNTGGQYKTQSTLGARLPARLSVFCESATLPPTRINVSQQKLFGPPTFHPQNADYGGDNISLTFMLDKWYTVKEFFDVWVDSIVNRETGTVAYQDDYLCQGMTITQLDEDDRAHYTAIFEDIFPISIAPIQLDAHSVNQVTKMNVTFCYRRWRSLSMTVASNGDQGGNADPIPPKKTPRENPKAKPASRSEDSSSGNPMGDMSGYGGGW